MTIEAMGGEQTSRLWQLTQELNGLSTILQGLQTTALHVVEEIENDFQGVQLEPEVEAQFVAMRNLITQV